MRACTIILEIRNGALMQNQKQWEVKTLTHDIIGHWVIAQNRNRIGKIHDVVVSSDTKFPYVEGLVVICISHSIFRKTKMPKKIYVPWQEFSGIEGKNFILKKNWDELMMFDPPENRLLLVKRILDEQLVDVKNMFAGRVEDINMIYTKDDNNLVVAGIYTGMAAMITRLGLRRYTKIMTNLFGKEEAVDIISWSSIKKICSRPRKIILKIRITKQANIYARALDEVAKKYMISIDDLENNLHSPKNEILVDRFGCDEIELPVVEKLEPFASRLKNKKLKKEYTKLFRTIEKKPDKYIMLIRSKKCHKRFEDIFELLVEIIKTDKSVSVKRLSARIKNLRKTLKYGNKCMP